MLWAILCFVCASGGYFILTDASTSWPTKVLGGVLGMISFGGSGLFLTFFNILISTVYNRIRQIPLIIIHEDRLELYIQVKGTYHTIYFTDVKRFRLIKIQSTKLIAVDYKVTSLIHKIEKSSPFTQRMMIFNFDVSGAIESLLADNLTMNGKKICDILNEHLNKNV